MTELYDEIQELRARYPESLSAVMPALQLAQERNGGWLSEQSFREVADALDLTPAYCLSIATFYDMFHLEPVGEHLIEVCTNISCGLRARSRSWRRSRPSSASRPARRATTSPCARSSASVAAAGRRSSRSTTVTGSTFRQATCRRIVAELRGVELDSEERGHGDVDA